LSKQISMKGMTFSKEPVVWLGLQERNCVMQSLKPGDC
jgi:hypothetical protein